MRVFLLNLDRDVERLAAVTRRLNDLNVEFERIPAVDGRKLPDEEKKAAVSRLRLWCAQGRMLRDGEIGCAMTHYSVYRKMLQDGIDKACILEDDVHLDKEFNAVLRQVEDWIDADKAGVVLLSNHTSATGKGIVRCACDMYTEGYVLTQSAARLLLAANWPLQAPCDHWFRWAFRGDIQLYHAFPTVCMQDQAEFDSNTGGGERVSEYDLIKWVFHKMGRIVGKSVDRALLCVEALGRRGVCK